MRPVLLDGGQTYVDGKRIGGATYAKGIQSLSGFCRHAGDVQRSSISERQVASFLDGPHTSPVHVASKIQLVEALFETLGAGTASKAVGEGP